ncbi:MAG: GDYXXLXY domain-containing protein [Betaproteobacteria bacterium]
MSDRLDLALERSIAAGLLPPEATRPETHSRPWPVVLLTGLGAWLAAIPLMAVIGLLLGDFIARGVGPYVAGVLLLGGALVVLRARGVPLFVEQLAVPALLAGGGSLGFGLFRDFHERGGAIILAVLAVAIALLIPRPWLRVLWGATAASLAVIALMPSGSLEHALGSTGVFWLSLHGLLLVWMIIVAVQHAVLADGEAASLAAAIEATATGWMLVVLAGLAFASGTTFLFGGTLGGGLAGEVARELGGRPTTRALPALMQATSLALAVAASGVAARAWPTLRQPLLLGVAAVMCLLAWFLPSLGAVLLAMALLATTQRFPVAAAAVVAMAWIIGSFYYQLQWPLTTKAAALAGAGAVLGSLALSALSAYSRRGAPDAEPEPTHAASGATPWLIALSLLSTLAVANFAIWQKETLIASGQPVFVPLAPVDPRSLMQGDYMRLEFRLPADAGEFDPLGRGVRPHVVAKRDARGVAALLRLDKRDSPLAADEFRIELAPKNGRWILVTDAWYFREGEAARWANARFGEFRVGADGKALLVGMADAELRAIAP